MSSHVVRSPGPILAAALFLMCLQAAPAAGQFDAVPVPEPLALMDFITGEWSVAGAFRTPDHIGSDRTLWYQTRGGGVTAFDGRAWVAHTSGSATADSIGALMESPADPFRFEGEMTARWIQDGFVLLLDEGRTSGTTLIYFDTAETEWVSTAFHAPSNSVTRSSAPSTGELPAFEGSATDRRGERTFRTRYELQGPDHFLVRTDVTFDGGVTWIDDQIVQEVRRRRP